MGPAAMAICSAIVPKPPPAVDQQAALVIKSKASILLAPKQVLQSLPLFAAENSRSCAINRDLSVRYAELLCIGLGGLIKRGGLRSQFAV